MNREMLNKLKENKYFPDLESQWKYRFPIVKHFIEKSNINVIINNSRMKILLEKPETESQKRLIIHCFNLLRVKFLNKS